VRKIIRHIFMVGLEVEGKKALNTGIKESTWQT
jgi:hypothetical protein